MPSAVGFGMAEQLPHYFKLVIAGKVEGLFSQGGAGITGNDGEVFNDVGEAVAGEQVFPEIGGFVAIGVGWVAFGLASL